MTGSTTNAATWSAPRERMAASRAAAPSSAVSLLGTTEYLRRSSSNGARQREPESESAPIVEPWYEVTRERNSTLPARPRSSQ